MQPNTPPLKLHYKSIVGSLLTLLFIVAVYSLSFSQVAAFFSFKALDGEWYAINSALKASFIQATLSTTINLIVAFIFANAAYSLNNSKVNHLIKSFNISFYLPSLIVISCFIVIYGNNGIINRILRIFDPDLKISIYGLLGVVAAHVYYLVGYSTNFLLNDLVKIPGEQVKLSQQLKLSNWRIFLLIKLNYCKASMAQIFIIGWILSFSSFAVVLFLGGGPKWSTLEVLIYQAANHQLNFSLAAAIGIIHLLISVVIIVATNIFTPATPIYKASHDLTRFNSSYFVKLIHWLTIIIASLFLLAPLFYLIASSAVSLFSYPNYPWHEIINASLNSMIVGGLAASLNILICIFLMLGIRWIIISYPKIGHNILSLSMMSLIYPSILLALGFFLLLIQWQDPSWLELLLLISVANSLTSLPFTLKFLQSSFIQSINQWKLTSQLKLTAWQRLTIIEMPYLIRPLISCALIALIMSLGDFSIIAYFANFEIVTLPLLVSYHLGGLNPHLVGITTGVFTLIILIFSFLYSWLLPDNNPQSLKRI